MSSSRSRAAQRSSTFRTCFIGPFVGLLTSWTSSTTTPRVANMMTSPSRLSTRGMPSGLASPTVRQRRPGRRPHLDSQFASSMTRPTGSRVQTGQPASCITWTPPIPSKPSAMQRHSRPTRPSGQKRLTGHEQTCLLGLEGRRGPGSASTRSPPRLAFGLRVFTLPRYNIWCLIFSLAWAACCRLCWIQVSKRCSGARSTIYFSKWTIDAVGFLSITTLGVECGCQTWITLGASGTV